MIETNIQIRRAGAKDAKYLAQLNDEFNGVGISKEEIIESLSYSNEIVVIALINDRPVGFACAQYFKSICYSEPYAEVTELYITGDARRQGMATKVLDFIENELILKGVRSVKVLTGKKNETAIKTYENSNYIKKEEQVLQKKL
ncbi:GNAT family N-acetyltransferase [Paenibacillus xylanexedens]|uniref:GNAT family N-acetyltransferase n=1 Tax=Paenibacillus xylanexedens TaxID=528191 RepID=UPI0021B3CF84|nr:GNAT family N-acetyltransferase [Paenibacillus xylanexedens]